MRNASGNPVREDSGATLIEYVLVVALIALLGVGAGYVGLPISNSYSTMGGHLKTHIDHGRGNGGDPGNGNGNGGVGNGNGNGNQGH